MPYLRYWHIAPILFVLLLVGGFAAMGMGIIGVILFVAGLVAVVMTLQINQFFQQERIEKKLDRLLADLEYGEVAEPAEELTEEFAEEPAEEQEETE